MPICSYCKKEKARLTKEHIFPNSLIKMFPNDDMCITPEKVFKSNTGQVIKDVCDDCNNNKLGALDSYGNFIIRDYFKEEYKKDEILELELDKKKLSRWLLKICFNMERTNRSNTEWYNINLDYILNAGVLKGKLELFGGLYVDMLPIPPMIQKANALEILKNPIIVEEKADEEIQIDKIFENILENHYSIKLGNAIFLIFLFKEESDNDKIEEFKKVMKENFSYSLILKSEKTIFRRVSSSILIPIISGINKIKLDDARVEATLGGRTIEEARSQWNNL